MSELNHASYDNDTSSPNTAAEWPIGDLLGPPALKLAPDLTLVDALQEMRDEHAGAALVAVDGFLVGVLERAIALWKVRSAGPDFGELCVAAAMTAVLDTLSPADTLLQALRKVYGAEIRAL